MTPSNSVTALPNRIRVETAISRFPIHRLTKKGIVSIDLQRVNESGSTDFKWEVTHNSKHGQPGPLAYKVDTLIINRLLDKLGRPLPEVIRIGSLSDVCRQLGTQDTGPNIASLKAAFLQNASAFINAKIRYKLKSGKEKWGEMGYTRYSVIFTGESLPDGRQADAVHIVLNSLYREMLNQVETRPLDYDYLKELSPGAQRFYELLSFQMYGAIAGNRPRAKLLYSEYCKYAPQIRYPDFDHVKKQMFKIHKNHRESGYIAKIDYERILDREGKPDWEMLYTPGQKAFSEYQAFTSRHPRADRTQTLNDAVEPRKLASTQTTLDLRPIDQALLGEMLKRGISEKKAVEVLSRTRKDQPVLEQIRYVDLLVAKDKRGAIENPPGLYVFYIRDNIQIPISFSREAGTNGTTDRTLSTRAESSLAGQYEDYRKSQFDQYLNKAIMSAERHALQERHRTHVRSIAGAVSSGILAALVNRSIEAELVETGKVPLLSFEQFCMRQNIVDHLLVPERSNI